MRAGGLDYKLDLYKVEAVSDRFGAQSTQRTKVRTVRGELVRQSGSRRAEVGEMFTSYDVEWNIRFQHEVRDGWEVVCEKLDGNRYVIESVVPNARMGMKTLRCVRVNE